VPYPERLLNEGEEIALDLHPHWWFFVREILSGAVLLLVFVFVLALFDGSIEQALSWVVGIAFLVWAVWLVMAFVKWRTTYFVVTSERVVYRTGVFARHGVEIPLDRINNINFHQGIIERIVGAGDLEIESAGEEGRTTFDNVWHPDGVQQEVYRQMKGREHRQHAALREELGFAAQATAAQANAAQGATVPEQLEQLASLRDRGIITPEEFEAKKSELLGRM
jgi:uncharacterized membrane protein YdbT with pleckstrin-like domain